MIIEPGGENSQVFWKNGQNSGKTCWKNGQNKNWQTGHTNRKKW